MNTATWPYGTRKRVRVDGIVRGRTLGAVCCVPVDEPSAAFVLLVKLAEIPVVKGDERFIVFTQGGPTGGHWAFETTNGGNT